MKKLISSFLFALLCATAIHAQYGYCPDELLPRYDAKKRLWGFANLMGQWEIEPFYTRVSPFSENKAIVRKGDSYGVIDCRGNVIVPYKYQAITSFSGDKAWFKENGLWGLMDHKGRVVISFRFDEILPIEYSEFAWAMKNDGWALFNVETGRQVGNTQFEIARPLSDNASMVKDANGLFGIINHVNGRYMVEPRISNIKKVSRGLLLYKLDGKWGMFSNEGKVLRNPDYDSIYMASPAHLVLVKDNKYGLMDNRGVTIIDPVHDEIGPYGDGLFPYRQGDKYGYINLLGKIHMATRYDMAKPFVQKQAIVVQNGLYGVIDTRGKVIIPFQYQSVYQHEHHPLYILTEQTDSADLEKIADLSGQIISPAFRKVFNDSGAIIRVLTDKGTRFWEVGERKLLPGSFSEASAFDHDYAIVTRNGLKGVCDTKGALKIPIQYSDIDYFWITRLLAFKTTTTDGIGLVRPEGKVILKNEYQEIHQAGTGLLKVRKNDRYGICKTDGGSIAEPVYDFMSYHDKDTTAPEWPAIIRKDGKYGLISSKGQEIVKPEYKYAFYSGERIYAIKGKKGYHLFDERGNPLNKKALDSVGATNKERIPVYNGKKWGFYNLAGEQVIDFKYDGVETFDERYCIVRIKDKFGLISKNGQTRLAIMYDAWKKSGEELFFQRGDSPWTPVHRLPVYNTGKDN